jgi:hypothetical protein
MSSQGAAQVDHHREPCPHRILDDIGGAFSMGAVGGGVFHAGKSLIWGPKGYKMRTALEVRLVSTFRLPSQRSHWPHHCRDNHVSTMRHLSLPFDVGVISKDRTLDAIDAYTDLNGRHGSEWHGLVQRCGQHCCILIVYSTIPL